MGGYFCCCYIFIKRIWHFKNGEKTKKMKTNVNRPPGNTFFEIVNINIYQNNTYRHNRTNILNK